MWLKWTAAELGWMKKETFIDFYFTKLRDYHYNYLGFFRFHQIFVLFISSSLNRFQWLFFISHYFNFGQILINS